MEPQPPARRRSPREDKDLDYGRQVASGSANGFRKHWPRRKAAVHRSYRRAQSAALAQPATLADSRIADRVEARVAATRREREPNTNQSALGDHVTRTLADRFLDMVDTFAAGPYQPQAQRERTERALAVLIRERPVRRPIEWSLRSTALSIDALLPYPVVQGHPRPGPSAQRRRDWFAAFLGDRPEWRPRLIRWIADRVAVH
jgi:hypothetical protein